MKIKIDSYLYTIIEPILAELNKAGIDTYLVGGYIRDLIMNIEPKDLDVCLVSKFSQEQIKEILEKIPQIEKLTSVHGSFPIWIIEKDNHKYEFAMARKERKIGNNHQSFECEVNNITIEQDLERRDFTMNAIAINTANSYIIDPFNGIKDINDGIIRHISSAFEEDVLRVYRAARFSARFNFYIHEDTRNYMMLMRHRASEISMERVGIELKKVLEHKHCSQFFSILYTTGWLSHAFPELYELVYVPQDSERHPEGSAFIHTLLTIHEAEDPLTRVVMLCHDLGKAGTTYFNKKGKLTCPQHVDKSVELTDTLLKRIKFADWKTIEQIKCLVELHMMHIDITEKSIRKALRKLMHVKLNYDDLVKVFKADLKGRQKAVTLPDFKEDYAQMLIDTGAMVPIVTGKKLLEIGVVPGTRMGMMLEKALEWQDRGTLTQENWQKLIKQIP